MTNKIISALILTTSIVFFVLAKANPDNLLFLFASPNLFICASRILLALGMCGVTFRNLTTNPYARQASLYSGFVLIAFGALSMVITPLGSAEYNYAKLLDWMILAEAGVVFALASLTTSAKLPANTKKATVVRAKAKRAKLRSRAA